MLDHGKVIHELQKLSDKLFININNELMHAELLWSRIINDPLFVTIAKTKNVPLLIPTWQEKLDTIHTINRDIKNYSIVGIDGSQIYPDRHQGTACSLINIGSVSLSYGNATKVKFLSEPFVLVPHEDDGIVWSIDTINCRRQELELKKGVELAVNGEISMPVLMLFDGSLIFWHLDPYDDQADYYFLSLYLQSLELFFQHNALVAWYISLPRSKELVNLLKLSLMMEHNQTTPLKGIIDHVLDCHVARFFLEHGTRSTVFAHHGAITKYYPEYLKPYFFYIHAGQEIGRVEIPAWIASDEKKIELVAMIIMDQLLKGKGYPVALAEAHEQAVVKGPDRDFFYHLIYKCGFERNEKIAISQKNAKKRRIGI